MRKLSIALSLLISALALTACQSTENGALNESANGSSNPEASQEAPETEQRVQRALTQVDPVAAPPLDASRELPDLEGELNSEGLGLTMIIDGWSPEAFADSLQMIAADTSPQQYQSLESAVQLLKVYSLSTNDLESFYQTLDGKTAEEIIELAQRRNRR